MHNEHDIEEQNRLRADARNRAAAREAHEAFHRQRLIDLGMSHTKTDKPVAATAPAPEVKAPKPKAAKPAETPVESPVTDATVVDDVAPQGTTETPVEASSAAEAAE